MGEYRFAGNIDLYCHSQDPRRFDGVPQDVLAPLIKAAQGRDVYIFHCNATKDAIKIAETISGVEHVTVHGERLMFVGPRTAPLNCDGFIAQIRGNKFAILKAMKLIAQKAIDNVNAGIETVYGTKNIFISADVEEIFMAYVQVVGSAYMGYEDIKIFSNADRTIGALGLLFIHLHSDSLCANGIDAYRVERAYDGKMPSSQREPSSKITKEHAASCSI